MSLLDGKYDPDPDLEAKQQQAFRSACRMLELAFRIGAEGDAEACAVLVHSAATTLALSKRNLSDAFHDVSHELRELARRR